jgi:hypothetical protein
MGGRARDHTHQTEQLLDLPRCVIDLDPGAHDAISLATSVGHLPTP